MKPSSGAKIAVLALLLAGCGSPVAPAPVPKLCHMLDETTLDAKLSLTDVTYEPPPSDDAEDKCEFHEHDALQVSVRNRPAADYDIELGHIRRTTGTPAEEFTMGAGDQAFTWRSGNHMQAGLKSHDRFFDISVSVLQYDIPYYTQGILKILEDALTYGY